MDNTKLKEIIENLSIEDLGEFIGYALTVLYKKLRDEHNFYYEATIVGDVCADAAHLRIIQDVSANIGTRYDDVFYLYGYGS